MAETSFPVLEKPLSDTQWKSVARGFGSGVLDEGGNPYNLVNADNISNQVTVAVDYRTGYNHAVVSGFYHHMDSPIQIQIPAVSAETLYYLVLQYDPARKDMPVKLLCVTSLNTSGGKENLLLWTIRRRPNQLLSDAVRTKYRPVIAPSIQVDFKESLPDPLTQLIGTKAYIQTTGEEYRAHENKWHPVRPFRIPLSSIPGWSVSSTTNGVQITPTTAGYFCTTSVIMTVTSGAHPWKSTYHLVGSLIAAGYRPTVPVEVLAHHEDRVVEAKIETNGALYVRSRDGGHTFPAGGTLKATFSWYTPKII